MSQTKAQLIDGKGAVDLGALSISESAPDNSVNLDTSGRLLVGTGTARTSFNITQSASLQVEGTDVSTSSISATCNLSSAAFPAAAIRLARTRGAAVGNTTLVQQDDIFGFIEFSGANGTTFARGATIDAAADGVPSATSMPGRLTFSTTPAGSTAVVERMRIASTGLVATFSSNGADSFYSNSTEGAGTTYNLFRGGYSATSTISSTASIRIYTNGNVQNTNNSYGALSDIKLKENIVDANSQWDDIKALQVRNYNLKEGQTHTQIGLVAQEVEPISPGLVYESPDRDEEGNDLGTVTKNVNYSVLYMKAVKALQEAMERIEQLEAKVAALEAA